MEAIAVQCLRCGNSRWARITVFERLETPECPACGYLGWEPVHELIEPGDPEEKRPPVELRLPSVA